MKNLKIDLPLTLKIIQNEQRIKQLFNVTCIRNKNKSSDYKYCNTDKFSDNDNFSSTKKDYIQPNITITNPHNDDIICQIASQTTIEKEKENSKKEMNVSTNKKGKEISKKKENRRNESSKINLSVNPSFNRFINNPINSFQCYGPRKSSLSRNITSMKFLNVDRMIRRFKEKEEKIREWIIKERTKKELEENKHYQKSPIINKKSKKINHKIKDGFLLRLQKSENEKQQKAEILKEFLKKKNLEQERKQQGMKGKSKTKIINFDTNKKRNEKVNRFDIWNIKTKAAIKFRSKNKFSFMPKINKRSISMAELRKRNYSTKNLFERLAKTGKNSKEKKII